VGVNRRGAGAGGDASGHDRKSSVCFCDGRDGLTGVEGRARKTMDGESDEERKAAEREGSPISTR
jgi:hypothetical protein